MLRKTGVVQGQEPVLLCNMYGPPTNIFQRPSDIVEPVQHDSEDNRSRAAPIYSRSWSLSLYDRVIEWKVYMYPTFEFCLYILYHF